MVGDGDGQGSLGPALADTRTVRIIYDLPLGKYACEQIVSGGPLLIVCVQDFAGQGDAGPADGDGVFGVPAPHEEADFLSGAMAIVAAGRLALGLRGFGHDGSNTGGRSILIAHVGRRDKRPVVSVPASGTRGSPRRRVAVFVNRENRDAP
jgi:hypothetical protein